MSISLHKVCHHAIYLERTFNCGQFLQSLDRIDRVNSPNSERANYYIPLLECGIELLLDQRLRRKQEVMYKLLDDDMPVLGLDNTSDEVEYDEDVSMLFRDLCNLLESRFQNQAS